MEAFLQPSSTSFPIDKFKHLKTSTPKPCKRMVKTKHNYFNKMQMPIKADTCQNQNIFSNKFVRGDLISEEKNTIAVDYSLSLKNAININSLSQNCPPIVPDISDQNSAFGFRKEIAIQMLNIKHDIDNRDGRSISPTSSFNGSLNGSINMTPDRLRQKYDSEFRDAIIPDLNILMDKNILEECKLIKEETLLSDDFDEFVSWHNELVAWLRRTLSIFSSKPICLSERHANQGCGEEMLQKLKSRESFEYFANRMVLSHPTAVEDIKKKREEVDLLWNQLQEIMNPAPQTITHLLIYKDVEVDIRNLSDWICNMQEQIDHISGEFKTRNASQNIKDNISRMILDLDRQFKCLTSITNVCNRMVGFESVVYEKFLEFHRRIPKMQQQCQCCYLQLLEWQLQLDSDQFVPRNINLEEIAEEVEEAYELLYSDDPVKYPNGFKNRMATLDRRISTSEPSLHQPPYSPIHIEPGHLTELEEIRRDDEHISKRLLRRADVIKDLTNLAKFNYEKPSVAFGKLNCDSNALNPKNIGHEIQHFDNIRKYNLDNCALGSYNDFGYSTGSKSPHSTENCSDSSGILIANNDKLMDDICCLKDPQHVSKTIKREIFDKSNQHGAILDSEINCNSESLVNFKKPKELYKCKINCELFQNKKSTLDDMKINSLVRKKKKVPTATLR